MGRATILVRGTLAMALTMSAAGALAAELIVEDGTGSYRFPSDCERAFDNSAVIARHMKARGREEQLNEFNHRCSVHLSGNPVGRAGTGIRALGSDMVDDIWVQSGARSLLERLRR